MPEGDESLRDADQALRGARVLFDEGLYGDAITRAYYGMLYAARALLARRGVHPKTHGGVMQAIGLHYVKPGLLPKESAGDLRLALEGRQRADYDSLAGFRREHAERVIDRAASFIETARGLLSSAP